MIEDAVVVRVVVGEVVDVVPRAVVWVESGSVVDVVIFFYIKKRK